MDLPRLRVVRPSEPTTPPAESSRERAPEHGSATELSAALEGVVRRFGGFMRRTAHRHNLGPAEIEEVMQETRIRLWKALGTSDRIQQAPASYIYRTVSSAALDFLRRRRARREHTLDDSGESPAHQLATARSAEDGQRQDEIQRVVAESIELLVESRRAVVRMYLAGFDREEMQELLGWSEAKTRNLLYRGLADLRATLESRGYGPGGSR